MNTNTLNIEIVDSPQEAPDYKKLPFKGLSITKVIIVGKGTVDKHPTIDIQLQDEDGNQFVTMSTGNLFEMLGSSIAGKRLKDLN